MLDHRLETFLTLCRIGNFTKTAEALHITQPAVTQHIKYLEEQYGVKLVAHEGKTFSLTPQGELLRRCAASVYADDIRLRAQLAKEDPSSVPLIFGATRTIGEFVIPDILKSMTEEQPARQVTMLVENTHTLLDLLDQGKLYFALVEGIFDQSGYETLLFSREDFIAVAAAGSPLCRHPVSLSRLVEERLLLREPGSGSREILELLLAQQNLRAESFSRRNVLGSIRAIKALTEAGQGITFLYRAAVEAELAAGTLQEIPLETPPQRRGFHFVFLRGSRHREENLQWFQLLKRLYEKGKKITPHR